MTMDKKLVDTAVGRCCEIASYTPDEFSAKHHDRPNGTECFTAYPKLYMAMAENLAAGYMTPADVVTAWMNSTSGHRENILCSSYNALGVGCIKGATYGTADFGGIYWVQCFGDSAKEPVSTGGRITGYNSTGTLMQYTDPNDDVSIDDDPNWKFTDFKNDSSYWAYDSIIYVYNAGIIKGYNADSSGKVTFGVNDSLTRGQFIVIMHRLAGSPTAKSYHHFSDLYKADGSRQYYYDAVEWAADNGIASGYAGTNLFGANDPVTRQQMAKILQNFVGYMGKDVSYNEKVLYTYSDTYLISDYARKPMAWAVENSIIKGQNVKDSSGRVVSVRLAPTQNATRAETAVIIKRVMDKYGF